MKDFFPLVHPTLSVFSMLAALGCSSRHPRSTTTRGKLMPEKLLVTPRPAGRERSLRKICIAAT